MGEDLRVLLACPPTGNPYVSELVRYLNKEPGVYCHQSHTDFFRCDNFDVFHVQWPESLFGWNHRITSSELSLLEMRLCSLKSSSKRIVVTVHNRMPHNNASENYRALYELLYNYVDSLVHLGKESIKTYQIDGFPDKPGRHFVIPHGNYRYFMELGGDVGAPIQEKTNSVLCFGAIRKVEEVRLINRVAKYLSDGGWQLVVAGRVMAGSKKHLRYYKMRLPFLFKKNIRMIKEHVRDEDVSKLVLSSDALLIPRLDTLNSGNVALGFTFGKPVLGPNTGVIGDELTMLGNPTFDHTNPISVRAGVEQLVKSVGTPLGRRNREYADSIMDWGNVARDHIRMYTYSFQ